MITVVIPVYHDDYLPDLLSMIEHNTMRPSQVIVIDNSGTEVCADTCSQCALPVNYFHQPANVGVNRSWNIGVDQAVNPLVAFLNDDLVIPRTLFEQFAAVHTNQDAGFVAPTPAPNPEIPRHWSFVTRTAVRPLSRRLGWCFSIRRAVATYAGHIPSELFTFFGDDWYFVQSKLQGFQNTQITNCPVYHYGDGVSASKHRIPIPKTLDEERKVWSRILSTLL